MLPHLDKARSKALHFIYQCTYVVSRHCVCSSSPLCTATLLPGSSWQTNSSTNPPRPPRPLLAGAQQQDSLSLSNAHSEVTCSHASSFDTPSFAGCLLQSVREAGGSARKFLAAAAVACPVSENSKDQLHRAIALCVECVEARLPFKATMFSAPKPRARCPVG